ncbi:restriction endonuclease subunit S [Agromyces neolithicus]|uniref:Restriction endonuclease subunit S n=1 Tax=Agromyces neolithicus TaxID=269420 RepID=A0ABN2MCN1_9MICO
MNPPADVPWPMRSISDIADFGSGDLISVAQLQRRRSPRFSVPVYGGNGIAGFTSTATVSGPTVILGRVGQKCGVVYRNSGPAWITDNALYARRFKRPLDVRFFALALEAARLNDMKNKNDLPLITQGILNDVKLAWPHSMAEQSAIADAVDDVDQCIGALERLVAKKQAIKQSFIQQLLTGDVRLPGFDQPWVSLPVASRSVLKARIGWQGLKTEEYRETGTHRLVGGTEFADGRVDWSKTPFVDKWRYDQDSYIQLRPGDVLLTKDGSIGKTAFVHDVPGPATLNSGVFVIRPVREAYEPRFLYFMLRSRFFEDFIGRLTAGSTINHLYQRDLVTLVLPAPASLEEQRKIAEVLSDAEAEVGALQTRLAKTRAIKTGMMQQLLSGRTQLPAEAAS